MEDLLEKFFTRDGKEIPHTRSFDGRVTLSINLHAGDASIKMCEYYLGSDDANLTSAALESAITRVLESYMLLERIKDALHKVTHARR